MSKGIQLTLLIGPAVPVPAPRVVLDALTSVRVINNSGGAASAFELTFTLSKNSPLNTLFLVAGGGAIPIIRVVIVATINGTPNVLIDGVMTQHDVQPGANGGPSTLTVKGTDLSIVMSFIDFSGIPYPAMPRFARVALILAKYAVLGIVPLTIPSPLLDVPLPTSHIPRQQGNDLAYIEQLAQEVGYVFYLEPGPAAGASVAYWGPEIKVGPPQPALNVDMDAHTNVESLSFGYASDQASLPLVWIQNEATKVPFLLPVPDVTPLSPPLGLVPPIPKQFPIIRETAKYSPLRGALIGMAKASQSNKVVTANGSLDVLRYGRILKSRKLVGVRGAGLAFDGLYYVTTVTHNIQQGRYTQDFTLSRNGLISTLPKVPA